MDLNRDATTDRNVRRLSAFPLQLLNPGMAGVDMMTIYNTAEPGSRGTLAPSPP